MSGTPLVRMSVHIMADDELYSNILPPPATIWGPLWPSYLYSNIETPIPGEIAGVLALQSAPRNTQQQPVAAHSQLFIEPYWPSQNDPSRNVHPRLFTQAVQPNAVSPVELPRGPKPVISNRAVAVRRKHRARLTEDQRRQVPQCAQDHPKSKHKEIAGTSSCSIIHTNR